jgi:hypothetical protein
MAEADVNHLVALIIRPRGERVGGRKQDAGEDPSLTRRVALLEFGDPPVCFSQQPATFEWPSHKGPIAPK